MDLVVGIGIVLAALSVIAPMTPRLQNAWVLAGIWLALVVYVLALVRYNSDKIARVVADYPLATALLAGAYAFLLVAGLTHSYVVPFAKARAVPEVDSKNSAQAITSFRIMVASPLDP
jgi:hypothetical protein